MTAPVLAHDVSRCFSVDDLAWQALRSGYHPPLQAKVLRRHGDDSPRSLIVRFSAGWQCGAMVNPADQQGLILSGRLRIGEAILAGGSFFFHPANSPFGPIEADEQTDVLMICAPGLAWRPAPPGARLSPRAILNLDTRNAPWIESVVDGRKTGIKRKVLWVDPETGADTRMLVVPPGFEGRGPNYHPCHEEIYCIEGDIGPDDRRLMRPGSYLHNPAFGVHGYHEHSRSGAVILEWHDGLWSYNPVDPASPLALPRKGGAA